MIAFGVLVVGIPLAVKKYHFLPSPKYGQPNGQILSTSTSWLEKYLGVVKLASVFARHFHVAK